MVFDSNFSFSDHVSQVIKSTALQAQYLPHKGELSALIKQNYYHRESRGVFKVSNPGLWV